MSLERIGVLSVLFLLAGFVAAFGEHLVWLYERRRRRAREGRRAGFVGERL